MVHFPRSRFHTLCIQARMTGHNARRVTPFGNLRISGCLLLPAAFRSLPRPSSPDSSEASTMNPYSLDHILVVHPLPFSKQRALASAAPFCAHDRSCTHLKRAYVFTYLRLFEPACFSFSGAGHLTRHASLNFQGYASCVSQALRILFTRSF